MGQEATSLDLEEAAGKYGIDVRFIRYWISRGWVRVLQETAGPGSPICIDESSLVDSLKRRGRQAYPDQRPFRWLTSGPPSVATDGRHWWQDPWMLAVALAAGAVMLLLLTTVFGLAPL